MKPLPNDTKHSLVTGPDAQGQMLQASLTHLCIDVNAPAPVLHSLHFVPGMLGGAKPSSFEGIRTGEPGGRGENKRLTGFAFRRKTWARGSKRTKETWLSSQSQTDRWERGNF